MVIVFILCIIVGILDDFRRMSDASHGIGSVPPSNNIFTFLFTDKY